MPQAVAEILERPDTDMVTLPNSQRRTVKAIRAEAHERQSVAEALKTGKVPTGRNRVRIATVKSRERDELLSVSKSLKDTARREALAAWNGQTAAPESAASQHTSTATPPSNPPSAWSTPAQGQGDPAAAWAQSGTSSGMGMGSKRRQVQVAALTAGAQATQIHSGIGSSTLSQAGPAFLPLSKSGLSTLSQQPSQNAVAQNTGTGIALVNMHSKDVQLTPGGLYTIIGAGFGETLGGVDLVGPNLPSGRLTLQVTQWSDRKLQAQLAEPMSGVPDQAVTLRVTTRTGTLYTKDVQFYATRQALVLSGGELDLNRTFEMNLGNQNDWTTTVTNWGGVTRSKSGNNIDCPNVGQDSLRTKVPAGWAVAEVSVTSWLPTQGDPNKDFYGGDGDTVVSGNYTITQIPAGITNQTYVVNWGVLRSHSANGLSLIPEYTGGDFGWAGPDGCVSGYGLEVTLIGPAGLRP